MLFITLIPENNAVLYLNYIGLMTAVNSHTFLSQFILPLSRLIFLFQRNALVLEQNRTE